MFCERIGADEIPEIPGKRTRTAADGDMHDATLAMDLDGTRHPLKEPIENEDPNNLRRTPGYKSIRVRGHGDEASAKQQPTGDYSRLKSTRRRTMV